MEKKDAILEEIKQSGLEMSNAVISFLVDMWNTAKDDIRTSIKSTRRLLTVSIVLSIFSACCMVMCVSLAFEVKHQAQEIREINDLLSNGIIIEETTTEEIITTQEVEGDSAIINNGAWEQYNDNSSNYGGDN